MIKNLKYFYEKAVILISYELIAIILVSLLLWAFFWVRDTYFTPNPVIHKYGMERLKTVYPDYSELEIKNILNESWSRTQTYDQLTGFKERARAGTYLNVSEQGFRFVKNQAEWPPNSANLNIFVFGGSSTFGYGVTDAETVPSYLQEILRENKYSQVAVYNFGQGRYFSTQERILFEKLLLSGFKPDIAVFIDGLNEYHPSGLPDPSGLSADIMDGKVLPLVWEQSPLGRAFTSLQQRIQAYLPNPSRHISSIDQETAEYNDPVELNQIIEVYLKNKKITQITAEEFGVKTLFVWQPVPLYNYNLSYNPFGEYVRTENDTPLYSKYTYPIMNKKRADLGNNFLWAADLQASSTEPLYVDAVHYTPILAKKIAELISQALIVKNYLIK